MMKTCPNCGAERPGESGVGLCPACQQSAEGGILAAEGTQTDSPSTVAYVGRANVEVRADLAVFFPQLEILELLGRGGMGEVYRARQLGLDRVVALKILPQPARHDAVFAELFAREARTLAQLNHPGIVTIFDFGETGGHYYFLMEHVEGGSLRQRLGAGRLARFELARLVGEICDALQFAHDAGIVHRDIKPENLLLDRAGRAKVADFGLAKLLGPERPDRHFPGTQPVMGTPRYMAPEQFDSPKDVDHRADIYAMGVVVYELLTGVRPAGRFAPRSERAMTDPRLDAVVSRALDPDPAKRYSRMADLGGEVKAAILSRVALAPERLDNFLDDSDEKTGL